MISDNRPTTLDEVLDLVRRLSPVDKTRLIERIASEIERDFIAGRSHTSISLLGLAKDLGPAPSAEEIDEARQHAWTGFPHDEN